VSVEALREHGIWGNEEEHVAKLREWRKRRV
jgi:hypothetical protein